MDRSDTTIASFVRYLNGLVPADGTRGDRAALAALRQNLGKPPGSVAEAAAHVDRFLIVDENGEIAPWDSWTESVLYALGGLFALVVKEPFPAEEEAKGSDGRTRWQDTGGLALPKGNFGASMRSLAEKLRRETGDPESGQRVDRRFISLLDADHEQVFEHLRYNVTLLDSNEVPVNWIRLGQDLLYWNDEERTIQRRWARAYWGVEERPRDAQAAQMEVAAGAPEPA